MEEALNGKLGEVQKVETHDGDQEMLGEFKPDAEVESVRVIAVNGNPEPVTENHERDDSYAAVPDEKSTAMVDSGEVEEEKSVRESVDDSTESEVLSPYEGLEVLAEQVEAPDDVTVLTSRVTEENFSQSLDERGRNPEVLEEAIALSLDANGGSSPVETEVVSKASDEMLPQSSPDDSCEVPPATAEAVPAEIEDTSLPALVQNPQVSTGTYDLASSEKVNESSQEAANVGSVDNKSEIPASAENQPITSMRQRTIQPTTWRSCCGLLEMLRRSNS